MYTVENVNYSFRFAVGEGRVPDRENFYCITEGSKILRVGKTLYLTDGTQDVPDQSIEPILITPSNYEELGVDSSYIGYYYITDADDLLWMSNALNDYSEYYSTCGFLQGGMISIPPSSTYSLRSTPTVWKPIEGFEGVYDGGGYTISGLYYNLEDYVNPETGLVEGEDAVEYVGMFATVGESGVVKNVNIVDSLFAGTYVGGICGENCGTIQNCSSSATVILSGAQSYDPYYGIVVMGGGIVGMGSRGTILNCVGTGEIYSGEFAFETTTDVYMGGVIGYDYESIVKNSVSNSQMTVGNAFAGSTAVTMGGIAGACEMSSFENSIHTGTMTTASAFAMRFSSVTYVMGGIAGEAWSVQIDNCYFDSDKQDVPALGSDNEDNEITNEVQGMSTKAFMDGTVAYLLGDAFGQSIGKDAYPVVGGNQIYVSTDCEGNEIFSNNEEADHIDVDGDGKCDTCQAPTEEYENPYDVNLDGIVNIADVNDLLVYLAGMSDNEEYHVDIDGNGVVNVADLNDLLVELAGM